MHGENDSSRTIENKKQSLRFYNLPKYEMLQGSTKHYCERKKNKAFVYCLWLDTLMHGEEEKETNIMYCAIH